MYLSNLKENLLHNDRHLYDRTLSELLQSPNAHLMAWNEEMRVALAERDRQFHPDQQQQAAYMHKWLDRSRDHPPMQQQKKKRRVSTRVRKRISLLHQRQLKRKRPIPHPSDEESQSEKRKR